MKILSIDVGIKNLALCILEVKDNVYNIIKWDVINLCGLIPSCNEIITKKNNKMITELCNKNSKYTKNGKYYCKSCAKKKNYIIPCIDLNSIHKKKIKIDDLKNTANKYNIVLSKKYKKQEIINILCNFKTSKCLQPIDNLSASDFSLIDIGVAIRENLNNSQYLDVDKILIENQISPLANRMKTIQGMIAQFYIMNNKDDIEFISASNKLKYFIGKEKTTYNERKKLSIEITKKILISDNSNWSETINKSNKKDDLADSFLQGLWYILEKNLAETNYNKTI
tara:strand:- start:28046 stop:28891 length:846 start_codon:yes stop_codon:yes gene_type:complete